MSERMPWSSRAWLSIPSSTIRRTIAGGSRHMSSASWTVSAKGPPVGTITVGALAASRPARVSQSAIATQSARLPPIWMTQAPALTAAAVSVGSKTESMAEIRWGTVVEHPG